MIGEFTHPNQVICEGKADETFLSRLLDHAGIQANVSCPSRVADGAQGKSGIRRRLLAFQSNFGTLARIVVVVDSDNDPGTAFAEAQTEFREANLENPNKLYDVPVEANVLSNGNPRTAIVQVPTHNTRGCLDTLLLPSFEDHCGAVHCQCTDAFCQCS